MATVSSFNSIETDVTEVLDLDPIQQKIFTLLKMLENCKDYFRLRLLIRSTHNNYQYYYHSASTTFNF